MDVMRIKAVDKDLENTDNWLVLFKIIEGNEDELFTIETDPKTNEGVLKLVKVNFYRFATKIMFLEVNFGCYIFLVSFTAHRVRSLRIMRRSKS